MMRCKCGFVMPAPAHGDTCKHYPEFMERLQKEIERESRELSNDEAYQRWRHSTVVISLRIAAGDGVVASPLMEELLKKAFDLARKGR